MASDFVDRSLGPWSSHPANLRKQRMLLLILGALPILAVIVLCVLVYKDLFSWKAFTEQIGLLTCSVFFVLGFLFTLCVLYLACFTIGSKKGRITNKDALIFPPWLLLVFCFFWLLPYFFSILPKIFSLLEKFGISNEHKTILNMLAIAPFLCVLTWILCAKEEELKENERLVRRPWVLLLALICSGLLGVSFFVPKYRLCMWIVLLPFSLILFSLWWLWRKKITLAEEKDDKKEEEEKAKEESEEGSEEEKKKKEKLPEQAAFIIKQLEGKDGISYDEDGHLQPIEECSRYIPENEESFPLIALMNGKIPTEDQADFLNRFSSLYEDSLSKFFESGKPNSEPLLPDIILQGRDGSGRTEALCAAAVYAAAVRGQKVLYIVQDGSYAASLAEKMKVRLQTLLVDCYYTADHLRPNFVDAWLPAPAKDPEKDTQDKTAGPVRELPPDILFATPEQVEQAFFNNSNLASEERREALRNILLSYSVVLVDDFLEMPLPLQAHLTFILDKLRLLQASEYVTGQFVIATVPLQDPCGIDSFAERLFGLSQFNRSKNAVLLRPRQCEPFWCGTLRISPDFGGEKSLENAARWLLDICTEQNYNTLFYSKGISQREAEELESDYEKKGTVSVSSQLYRLNVEKMPFDTILYLSLTSGNAAAALRLSLPDDKAGTPVFFRIALEQESEKSEKAQFALLPNETAISLRAYHLRSVLPFLPRLTPISASVWSHFGISLTHPCCREANIKRMPEGLSVSWFYDYYTEPNRYGENVIWPYLVLASGTTISNIGQSINFGILPSTKDSILLDKRQKDPQGDALFFVSGEKGERDGSVMPSQVAIWRDALGNSMGTTDLAHADLLTLVTADNLFSVGGIHSIDKHDQDASRYAMNITAQPRRMGLSYDIPVRHFSWNLPEGSFQVSDLMCYQKETASFFIRFGDSFTNPISAEINGLMNALGLVCSTNASSGRYSYDAFMSCIVFLPEANCGESDICASLYGRWSTDTACGFSSPLTHAFSIALRNRMSGLSFFAMTPVFLIEGRDGSCGRLLLWLQEPYNSGSTVYRLLVKKLLPEPDFKRELLKDIQSILVTDNNELISLEELRKLSQMAFTGEDELSSEQWRNEIENGLNTIRLLMDPKALKQDIAERAERRKEEESRRAEERKKRQAELVDPTLISEEDRKQYEEFASQVTADLMDFKEVLDVSRFCVDYGWSAEKVTDVFNDFLWNSPDIFFVAKSHRSQYSYMPDGRITKFFITDLHYGIEKGEYREAKRKLDEEMEKAMKLVNGVADPVKKALILHDHIIQVCDYDQVACDTNDSSPLARTAYSVLVRHCAVCEGYTMAYRYLLNRAGIRSEEVLSDKMHHCWNYLYLNGNWYHVDVTWDDNVFHGRKPKNMGICHEYFLLSDEKIAERKHQGWNVRGLPRAWDTQFDNMDWRHG